ncbi:MAG: guanylate kinase [Cryomorphaceae bacterium]|nr:guanylate kinase [Flavobacteriales bacterium]
MATKEGKCIIVSAPSGSGKTTIVKHLLKAVPGLQFSVSATSRGPRPTERHEKDYYFMDPDGFRKKIEEGAFLEWEEVYTGQYYGTLKSEVERIRYSGGHVIFDLDVEGGVNLKKYFGGEALAIFIRPPSIEALEARLRNRSTESEENLKVRLDKAKYELEFSGKFDYVLVNDDLNTACEEAISQVMSFLNA